MKQVPNHPMLALRPGTRPTQGRNRRWQGPRSAGVTLLEIIFVLTILLILAVIGFPSFQKAIRQTKVRSCADLTALTLRKARLEAIKRSQPVGVFFDTTDESLVGFLDFNNSGGPDDCDAQLTLGFPAPEDRVHFGEVVGFPTGVPPIPAVGSPCVDPLLPAHQHLRNVDVTSGPADGWVLFTASGSASIAGAVRCADEPTDPGGPQNVVEVRVDNPTVGRIILQKWFWVSGQDWTAAGNWYAEHNWPGGTAWEWY
jgi:type II secretory pathway pseudopilin PulG